MPFWSNQTLRRRLQAEGIVSDYDADCVKYCAYELKLGDEVFLTSSKKGKKEVIGAPGHLSIPPGQFALLITKEVITIPKNVVAWISIKATIKFRGLVNVSGFHVDPGFTGRLKFSVFNAGGQRINLAKGQPVFLIFFADLDAPADPPYDGEHQNQTEITSADVMAIQGKLASPSVLDGRLTCLENKMTIAQTLLVGALFLLIGLAVKSCDTKGPDSSRGLVQISIPQASISIAQPGGTNPATQSSPPNATNIGSVGGPCVSKDASSTRPK